MPKLNKYNVYDNDKLIIENQTSREIKKKIDCGTITISTYADTGDKYAGRYTFELYEEMEPETKDAAFAREWNAAVALFGRVVWVKSGGRKLMVGGRR